MIDLATSFYEKTNLVFKICDLNDDNFISKEELLQLTQSAIKSCGQNMSMQKLNTLIDITFEQIDSDKNQLIDKLEFNKFCENNPRILRYFTIDIQQLLEYEAGTVYTDYNLLHTCKYILTCVCACFI